MDFHMQPRTDFRLGPPDPRPAEPPVPPPPPSHTQYCKSKLQELELQAKELLDAVDAGIGNYELAFYRLWMHLSCAIMSPTNDVPSVPDDWMRQSATAGARKASPQELLLSFFGLTPEEISAVGELGEKQELSALQVVRQSIRLYQLTVTGGATVECRRGVPFHVDNVYSVRDAAATAAAMPDVETMVCDDIKARQRLGIAKYGMTVADNPLSLRQWLQHALEECLDQAVYLRRAILEIDTRGAETVSQVEIARLRRELTALRAAHGRAMDALSAEDAESVGEFDDRDE